MELHITIELKGEALNSDRGELRELGLVLDRLHASFQRSAPLEVGDYGRAYDTNGQSVARWEVTE